MQNMNYFFKAIVAEKASSRTVVLLTALIIVFGTPILMYGIWNKPSHSIILQIRIVHWLIGAGSICVIMFLKDRWKSHYGSILYALMFIPMIFTSWYNHVILAESGELGKPFVGFPVVFMMLAAMVPYSYILNTVFLTFFTIEALVIWYGLDLAHKSHVIASGEPFYVLIFSFVSFCLLYLRYRLDARIHVLMEQKTRSEFIENIARTFLSIRDRTNTPLQSLLILSESVKNEKQLTDHQITVFRNSVQSLINLNKKLVRYETQIQWGKRDLMTDQEIDAWLEQIETEAGKEK